MLSPGSSQMDENGNIERLLSHLAGGSLAARLVEAIAVTHRPDMECDLAGTLPESDIDRGQLMPASDTRVELARFVGSQLAVHCVESASCRQMGVRGES